MDNTENISLHNAIIHEAQRSGITPEDVVVKAVRERIDRRISEIRKDIPGLIEPRDDWERCLASIGTHTGISLTDEQVRSESTYQDYE